MHYNLILELYTNGAGAFDVYQKLIYIKNLKDIDQPIDFILKIVYSFCK